MALGRVVIIGGGAIGSSIAYWLTGDPAFAGDVVVIERDPTYRQASSALSASSIRQQFSTPVNIAICRFGFGFLRGWATAGGRRRAPDIGLVEPGYLFLATAAGEAVLRANHEIQVARAPTWRCSRRASCADRFPWLSADGVPPASLGLHAARAGSTATACCRRSAARRARSGRRTSPPRRGRPRRRPRDRRPLADGSRIAGDAVVDAAGPWAGEVAAMAGIELPVRAARGVRCSCSSPDAARRTARW